MSAGDVNSTASFEVFIELFTDALHDAIRTDFTHMRDLLQFRFHSFESSFGRFIRAVFDDPTRKGLTDARAGLQVGGSDYFIQFVQALPAKLLAISQCSLFQKPVERTSATIPGCGGTLPVVDMASA